MGNGTYVDRLKEFRREIERTPFDILVWGPGLESDSIEGKKRLALRESLEGEFGKDQVHFSEDPDLTEWGGEHGLYAKEFVEASVADAIIAIGESIGAVGEIALYRDILAGKSLVFVKDRLEGDEGFASETYRFLTVESIKEDEWKSCTRIRRIARQFVERLRVEKYRNENRSR